MNWKIIGRSLAHKDMRKRILAVVGILLVYRIMVHIPVPLSDPQTLKQVLDNVFSSSHSPQFLSFLNVLSGGALANFSIMLAGLGPYVNAQIIMQLLTRAIPRLEALQKEGEYGQKKINQYTRLLTFPLAIIQSITAIYLVRQSAQQIGGIGDITANASILRWVLMAAALTGGSMLLMWLGELLTEQSIGNGISLLVAVSVVSTLPSSIATIVEAVFDHTSKWYVLGKVVTLSFKSLVVALSILAGVIILTWLVVKLNEAARNITVNYAKRVQGNRAYGGVTTTIPVKLITAGVVPIIFAVTFLSVPSYVGQLLSGAKNAHWQHIGTNLTSWFTAPTSASSFKTGGFEPYIYPIAYFLLVFVFTFFYTSISFNSKEMSENLQKQNGFIAGIRSGQETDRYLSGVVRRLTFFGAICIGLMALLPIIVQVFVTSSISIGGTSILILVSVLLQTLRALESRALMITYDQYSQPDFFYEPEGPGVEVLEGRRRFLPKLRRSKKDNGVK